MKLQKRLFILVYLTIMAFGCSTFEKKLPCISENKPKYYLELTPYAAYFDYEEGLACARKCNRPILLIFTGLGVVNSSRMNDYLTDNEEIMQYMNDHFVVIDLYVDDRRKLPENELYISDFSGRKMKTIGNKWADFQSKNFQRGSQPCYHILDLESNELIELRAYFGEKEAFLPWLKKGLAAFQESKN